MTFESFVRRAAFAAAILLLILTGHSETPIQAQSACGATINAIVCENQNAGSPASEWDVTGSGDSTIQGFATDISVAPGQVQQFKIKTPSANYGIDIYRMGYYSGAGARKIATVTPSAALPQNQPACLNNAVTGLNDCGNWAVSASWTVPSTAVSGIYFARLTRFDTGGASHIFFVVRESATAPHHADIVFQTSDTTWQAYNQYGGNGLYVGGPATNPGRAYKVSYNRPITTRSTSAEDFVFNAEYPMARWLEANGYDVSYMTGVDADRDGASIRTHRVYVSVGHDEYWSGGQRANIETARAAGVHLAFFSGNEVFWKTRWEASIDGSGTPYRTLVCYKETHANAVIDPLDPPAWTGTWADPRFSPPADGGRPQNALTGTQFQVNDGDTGAITVPAANGKLRFWRNTSVATLAAGATATLPTGTLGYEWDGEVDNGFRPSGLMRLSQTTKTVSGMLLDYGSTYGPGTVTHALTLYRASSGALVFGAGTVQWSWGLDATHDRGGTAADVRMKQATVNLLADMGAQPGTLQAGLVTAAASVDTLAPTSTISAPAAGASFVAGSPVTISGSAADTGGGIVAGVEVSTDGGTTWRQATGTTSWTFNWTAAGLGNVTIKSRAFDDSGNMEAPKPGVTVTVTATRPCPCSVWASTVVPPAPLDDNDPLSVELGMKFRSEISGFVTGVRFYKAGTLNGGTHTGSLWTAAGALLGTVTFTGETASGWQQATFGSPIAISASTTYVVSYHAPNGHYTGTDPFFATSAVDNPPLHALKDGTDGPNGVYAYGSTSAFPTVTFDSENYWVDVVFTTTPPPDTTPPTVTAISPSDNTTSVDPSTAVTATFSEAMDPTTISSSTTGSEGGGSSLGTFELRDPANNLVPAAVAYDATSRTAALQPRSPLALSTRYSVVVKGGASDPRVKDAAGNAMTVPVTWSFTTAAAPPPPATCPCSIWPANAVPNPIDDLDTGSVELGTKFRSDVSGYVTGARFYKGSLNTGIHTATLWSNAGAKLATATFAGETSAGWQQLAFSTPVAIAANTTYVISYHAPNGHYPGPDNYFATNGVDSPPLHALKNGADGPNGVYAYGATTAFPTETWMSEGYFVDVVFNTSTGPDLTPPRVSAVAPASGATSVAAGAIVTVTFNEPVDATTINTSTIQVRDPSNRAVPATVTYSATTLTATLTPSAPLAYATQFTGVVTSGVRDVAGNATTSDYSWPFTTTAPPPPPPTQGPGGPVLVVTSASNPFTTYYAEILRAEGVNAFATADLTQVTAAALANYDVVILGEMPLTAAQVTMFSTWVSGGGNLIAMRPDKQLASLLGLTDAASTLADAYLLVNTAAAPGAGIVNQTIQFHGTADRYTLNGATALATLYSNATTATSSPAVTMRTAGSGRAVAFTYDLAKSVVYTRQGNPLWSGQERDGQVPIRSDDLYFGAKTGDIQPDYVDLARVAIPQADEQQRFLWNIILNVNASKKPLPRFWYFPRMLPAVVVMTGDDHANGGTAGRFNDYLAASPTGCSVADWTCIRGTSYIYPNTPITDAQVANYVAQGFEIALHVNSNCADWTPSTLAGFYSTQLAQFASAYPHAPTPATNRTHCIVWSDYATQPQIELNNNIRLDTTYYYWPGTWLQDRPGVFTGSGMPQRFATVAGQMIDVYQAATQMTDESGQTYPKNIDALLDNAVGPAGYYGAFTANMHTDFNPSPGEDGSNAIVASAKARQIPVIAAKQMLDWLDGRNGSSFQSIAWNGSVLSFNIAVLAGANGLQALVPASTGANPITSLTFNGGPVAYTTQTIKGIQYAAFPAATGLYQVTYGPDVTPPSISAIAASAGTSTATITWTTTEASDSNVTYGTSPGSLTQSSVNTTLTKSHSIALTGLNGNTVYYFRVSSADAAGNRATSPSTDLAPATFTTAAPTLSGNVAPASVVGGTLVTLLGPVNANTFVDASGTYVFSGLSAGTYTVTPTKSGYTFTPANQGVPVTNASVTNVNFSAQPVVISGTIGPGSSGAGAQVTLSGAAAASATADASGNYAFSGVADGTYTVTPAKTGFTLTPANQSVTIAGGASATAVNFTAQPLPTFSVSGAISPSANGAGATVTLSGSASATVTADASGGFTFSGLLNGTYTVTPAKSGYAMTPPSQTVTVNGANVATAPFTATPSGPLVDVMVSTDRSSAAATIASPAFTTQSGNELLLAFVSTDNSQAAPTTVTGVSGGGLTWVLVRRTNAQRGDAEIWRAFTPTTLSGVTATATLSQSVPASITIMTFTGVDTTGTSGSGAIGATGSGNALTGLPSATLTTTRANSLVIGVGSDWDNAVARTPVANQTVVHEYQATVGDTYWVQRVTNLVAASGTVVTISDTAPTGDRFNLTICEILGGS